MFRPPTFDVKLIFHLVKKRKLKTIFIFILYIIFRFLNLVTLYITLFYLGVANSSFKPKSGINRYTFLDKWQLKYINAVKNVSYSIGILEFNLINIGCQE